jgi:hypothetical protein
VQCCCRSPLPWPSNVAPLAHPMFDPSRSSAGRSRESRFLPLQIRFDVHVDPLTLPPLSFPCLPFLSHTIPPPPHPWNGALARPDHRAHHRVDQLAACSAQNSESASQSDLKSAF